MAAACAACCGCFWPPAALRQKPLTTARPAENQVMGGIMPASVHMWRPWQVLLSAAAA